MTIIKPEKIIGQRICLALALQLVVLLGIAGKRAYTVSTGTAIALQASTFDPCDIFRGDYVNLRYDISSAENIDHDQIKYGDAVYTVLEKDHPYWKAIGTYHVKPELKDSQIMLKGKALGIYSINYGIEKFFVPEGKGKDLQSQKHLHVEVAVDKDGTAIVKSVVPE